MRVAKNSPSDHARSDLDDAAEHVGGHAVFPGRARLEHQRQPAELLDQLGVGLPLVHQLDVAPQHLHRRVAELRIGQPRGVAQQVLHGHRAPRPGALDADRHLGEFRQVLRDRRGDFEPSFLGQHHRRDRGHRLGHRRDAEDRVERHRRRRPRGPESRTPRQSRPARRAPAARPRRGSACARHPGARPTPAFRAAPTRTRPAPEPRPASVPDPSCLLLPARRAREPHSLRAFFSEMPEMPSRRASSAATSSGLTPVAAHITSR